MTTEFITGKNLLQQALKAKERIVNQSNAKALMMLACDENGLTADDYNELSISDIPIFGGIFPQIIFGNKNFRQGILMIGLENDPEISVIKNISDQDLDFEEQFNDSIPDEGYQTFFVFLDGFSSRISDFINALFNVYGIEMNFIGGGVGSLSMEQKPCIITNDGLLKDAAVVVAVKAASGIGVKHGWEPLRGPYKVSLSEGNVVQMLENKPAFEIYKQVVEEDSGEPITAKNFFEKAKAYPFGISKLGEEKIVRDPIVVQEDGSLICVGEVPQNAFVDILKGNNENLIEASRNALANAKENAPSSKNPQHVFFIDCISRVLFLENDFQKELDAVADSGLQVTGVLTLGEIANSGRDYLEFYNKTSVVAIIENL
jgi:hypothetical protein